MEKFSKFHNQVVFCGAPYNMVVLFDATVQETHERFQAAVTSGGWTKLRTISFAVQHLKTSSKDIPKSNSLLVRRYSSWMPV